jgi:hypothetical protein
MLNNMDKILDTYKEIIVASRKNTVKTFSMAIILIVFIIAGAFTTIKLFSVSQSNILILDYDGHVRNPKLISPDQASIIKAQAFIDDFCNHFFAFTPYNIQENLEYAVNLGDDSVKDAYLAFMSKNWYNDVVQNNLIQTVSFLEDPAIQPFESYFSIDGNIILTLQELSQSSQNVKYILSFSCTAEPIQASYPKFKQGLFITNFSYNITEYNNE